MTFVQTSSRGGSITPPPYVGFPWGATAQGFGSASYFAVQVWVPTQMTFSKWAYRALTVSGNMFLAVYDVNLNRVHTTGSFAISASGSQAIGGGLSLSAGTYWFMMQMDNGTAALAASGGNDGSQLLSYSNANTYGNGAPATLTLGAGGATVPAIALVV